jgi:hypothetical protein
VEELIAEMLGWVYLNMSSAAIFVLILLGAVGGLSSLSQLVGGIWRFLRKRKVSGGAERHLRDLSSNGRLVVCLFVVWTGVVVVWTRAAGGPSVTPADFGDAFGFLTSVFTGLGFAGLYSTLKLQTSQSSMDVFYRLMALRNGVVDRMTFARDAASRKRVGYDAVHGHFDSLVQQIAKCDSWRGAEYMARVRKYFADHAGELSAFLSANQVIIQHLAANDSAQPARSQFLGFLDRKEFGLLCFFLDQVDERDLIMTNIAKQFSQFDILDSAEIPTDSELHGRKLTEIALLGNIGHA